MYDRLENASGLESGVRSKNLRTAASILALFLSFSLEVQKTLADDGGACTVPAESSGRRLTMDSRCIDPESMRVLAQSVLGFRDYIMIRINRYVSDPGMREKIRRVFKIAQANMGQSKCNIGTAVVPVDAQNPGLDFALAEGWTDTTVFNGSRRRISIPKGANFGSLGLRLQLAHEFAHVDQDDELRRRVPKDRYDRFWSEYAPVVIPHEIDAIERAIEILNIQMRGSLKAAALKGCRIDLPLASPQSNANFMSLAIFYYRKDRQGFEKMVRELYLKQAGVVFYTVDLEKENTSESVAPGERSLSRKRAVGATR